MNVRKQKKNAIPFADRWTANCTFTKENLLAQQIF